MSRSQDLFAEAQKHIPGGVNSPVRAVRAVGGEPVFFKRASGAYLYDEDDNAYVDYVGSWGPMVLGHAHPEVIAAVKAAVDNGLSFGAPTRVENEMAAKVCELVPSCVKVRMVHQVCALHVQGELIARSTVERQVWHTSVSIEPLENAWPNWLFYGPLAVLCEFSHLTPSYRPRLL